MICTRRPGDDKGRRANLGDLLCRRGGFDRDDVDAATAAIELDDPFHQREQRKVAPLADALAGVELRAALTDEDVAREYLLAAEPLDAAALRVRVTTVAAGTLALLMCHDASISENFAPAGNAGGLFNCCGWSRAIE
jgi:hypothetical protein